MTSAQWIRLHQLVLPGYEIQFNKSAVEMSYQKACLLDTGGSDPTVATDSAVTVSNTGTRLGPSSPNTDPS